MDKCCCGCFKDMNIIKYITKYGENGNCPFCGSTNVKVLPINKLGVFLRKCLSKAYEDLDEGSGAMYDSEEKRYIGVSGEDVCSLSVYEILVEQEDIFSQNVDSERMLELIFRLSAPTQRDIQNGEIDEYPDIYDSRYVFKDALYDVEASDEFYQWEYFKHITMYYNRYFDVDSSIEGRNQLLDKISIIFPVMEENLEKGSIIYRARPMESLQEPFSEMDFYKEISPAPPQFASNNRMSPQGISYTYLAADTTTCYKECRMKKGDHALLGTFEIRKNLKVLNLSSRKSLYIKNSIFSEDYNHGLNWINQFIKMFSWDISAPMDSKDKSIEYIPTQIIAEYIRSKGYDGIKFESSVKKGSYNYTLFCGPNREISSEFYPSHYGMFGIEKYLTYFTKWMRLIDIKFVELVSDDYQINILNETTNISRSDIITEIKGISDFDCIEEVKDRILNIEQYLSKEYKSLIIDGHRFSIEKYIKELLEDEGSGEHTLCVDEGLGWLTISIDKKNFTFENKRGAENFWPIRF